jgi:hypothetical protein
MVQSTMMMIQLTVVHAHYLICECFGCLILVVSLSDSTCRSSVLKVKKSYCCFSGAVVHLKSVASKSLFHRQLYHCDCTEKICYVYNLSLLTVGSCTHDFCTIIHGYSNTRHLSLFVPYTPYLLLIFLPFVYIGIYVTRSVYLLEVDDVIAWGS